jgi:cytochrome c biogenesis protein CcmG/thiol:disulfide interchange protein DsbE
MRKIVFLLLLVTILLTALFSGCAQSLPQKDGPPPDFTLTSLDGLSVTLSELRGRPVLLNFWATWCPPCRLEMPYFQEIHEDPIWRARELLILAVNLQESATDVRRFMTDNAYTFTVLLDTKAEAARLYNASSIPATYIIGKDGIIKYRRIGAFAGKSQIEQMLLSAIGKE